MILVCRRHTKCAGQGVLQDRFGNHCFNVLGSQNAYPSIETNISQTQFYLLFLTNYITDVVRFKFKWCKCMANHGGRMK